MEKKKRLVDKLGEKNIETFLRYLAEERAIREIARLMPDAFKTHNAVVATRRDYKAEIEQLLAAYLVAHGPVVRVGTSRPFLRRGAAPQPPHDAAVAAKALFEWREDNPLNPYQYAIAEIDRVRGKRTNLTVAQIGTRILHESGSLRQFLKDHRPPGFSNEEVEAVVARVGKFAKSVFKKFE